jgi:hypothetical protein
MSPGEHIIEYLERRGNVTFVELANYMRNHIPVEGDYALELSPNTIIWQCLSAEFCNAFHSVRKQIELISGGSYTLLTYTYDGTTLPLPIAKRPPKNGYKEPHWFPVTISKRDTG